MLVLQIVVTTSTLGCYFYGSGTNSSRLGCDDSAVDNAAHGGNYYIADTTKCWGAEINAAFNQNVFPTLNGALCGCHSANGWHYAESVNGDAACFRTRDNINQNAQYNGPEIKCGTNYFNSGFLYYSSAEDCKAGVAKLNAIIVPLATPPPPPPPPPPTEAVRIGCDCHGSGNCYPADTTKPFNCGFLCEDHECWVGAMNEAFNEGENLMFHCSGSGWHYAHYEANCETTRDNINQHDQYEGGPEIKCRKATKYDHYLYYSSAEDCKAGIAKLNAIMPGRINNMPITTVDTTTTTTTQLATTTQPATPPPPITTQKTTRAQSSITTTITVVAGKNSGNGGTSSGIDTDATTTIPAATATILAGKNSGNGGTSSGIDTDATTTIPAATASTRTCPDMDPPGCGLDASKCGTLVYGMATVTETCPILCNACTAAVALCNGAEDPPYCRTEYAGKCADPIVGENVRGMCKVECGTCVAIIVPDASGAAGTQKKGNGLGGIVGGVLGGVALFLVVFGAVVYRCGRVDLGESKQPYGQTTQNPTFNTPENAAAPLSPQEDSTV